MTYKFVGYAQPHRRQPYQRTASGSASRSGCDRDTAQDHQIAGGVQEVRRGERTGFATNSSSMRSCCHRLRIVFGGFVNLPTSAWFAAGGVVASIANSMPKRKDQAAALPEDMSTASLVGGGLIAGDALAALGLGVAGLLATVFG